MSNKVSQNNQSSVKTVILTYAQPNNYPEWIKWIQNKAVAEFGEVGKCVKYLKFKKFRKPVPPPEMNETEKMIFSNDLRVHQNDKRDYKEKRVKLFAFIMEYVSAHSRTAIESDHSFNEAEETSHVVALMIIIQRTHQPYAGLEDTVRTTHLRVELINKKQKDQRTINYCHEWREKIRYAVLAGVTFDDHTFWVSIFLESLSAAHKDFVDSILDPSRRIRPPPATLMDAIARVEEHNRYVESRASKNKSNPPAPANQPAVVANTTVQKKNAGSRRREKGKKGSNSSSYCQPCPPANGGGSSAKPARPDCRWCKKKNPTHDPDNCWDNPANKGKREEFRAKRQNKQAAAHAQFKTMFMNVMADFLMDRQP